MGIDQLISVEEAARRLGGISKWTVHAWLSQGKLRRTKVGGRTMIRESELARVIRDEETPAELTTAPTQHNQTRAVGRPASHRSGNDNVE
jgi:excisionase family DNA binding protein